MSSLQLGFENFENWNLEPKRKGVFRRITGFRSILICGNEISYLQKLKSKVNLINRECLQEGVNSVGCYGTTLTSFCSDSLGTDVVPWKIIRIRTIKKHLEGRKVF